MQSLNTRLILLTGFFYTKPFPIIKQNKRPEQL